MSRKAGVTVQPDGEYPKIRLSIALSEDARDRLDAYAKEKNISRSYLIEIMIDRLKDYRKKQ